jgi:hypothetical protein
MLEPLSFQHDADHAQTSAGRQGRPPQQATATTFERLTNSPLKLVGVQAVVAISESHVEVDLVGPKPGIEPECHFDGPAVVRPADVAGRSIQGALHALMVE